MDNKMRAYTGILSGLVLILTILFGYSGTVTAQERCLTVHIRSQAGIEPETLRVNKGDCVVWINWTRGEDVQVIFREGKKCADMTKSPIKFKPDFSGCYLTDFLAFGETSSLVFAEAGVFNYEIEFKKSGGGPYGSGSTRKFGSIIVN